MTILSFKYQRLTALILLVTILMIPTIAVAQDDDGSNGDTSQNNNDYSSTNEVTSSSYDSYGNEWSSGTDSSSVGEGSIVGHSDQVAENHGNGGNDGGGQRGQDGEGGRAEGQFGTNGGEQGFDTGWDAANGDPMAADRTTLVGLYEAGKYGEVGSREAIAAFSQTYAHTAEAHGGNPAQVAGDLKDTLSGMSGISQSTIADAVGYAMAGGEEAATPQQVANSVYNQLTNNGNVTSPEAAQASWNHAVAVAAANGMDIGSIQAPNGVSNPTSVSVTSSGVSLTSAADAPGTSTNISISVGFNASGGTASTTQGTAPSQPAAAPQPNATAPEVNPAAAPQAAVTAQAVTPVADPNYGYTPSVGQAGNQAFVSSDYNIQITTTTGHTEIQVNREGSGGTIFSYNEPTPHNSGSQFSSLQEVQSFLQSNGSSLPQEVINSAPPITFLKKIFNSLVTEAFAQNISPPLKLDSLPKAQKSLKSIKIENYIKEHGSIDQKTINAIMASNILESSFQPVDNGYKITTGRNGKSQQQINQGNYSVKIPSIDGYSIKTTLLLNVDSSDNHYLGIGVKSSQTTKLEYISSLNQSQNTSQFQIIKTALAADPTGQLLVFVFDDKNGSGILDKGEAIMPWANMEVNLTKFDEKIQVKLDKGWNLVGVPTDGNYKASTLLAGINSQSGDSKTISVFDQGAWQSYSHGSGTDFDITFGKAYFILSEKGSLFIPSGTPVTLSEISLNSGWNALTVPALDALDLAAKLGLNDSTTLSSFKKGQWDTYQINENLKFGSNFKLTPTQGVLIKVKNQKEASF